MKQKRGDVKMAEKTSLSHKKRDIAVAALIFALCVAAVRAADIFAASLGADVMTSGALPEALGIAATVLSVTATAFSGGALIYFALRRPGRAFFAAASFSAVIILDRSFYVIYNIATRVKTFTPSYGAEAYIRVIADSAAFVGAYFITAAVCRTVVSRLKSQRLPVLLKCVLAFALSLFALQTAYQIYVTADFFIKYDDVTSAEKAAIAGDYLFILLKYGIVQFGAAAAFYRLFDAVFKKRGAKTGTDGDPRSEDKAPEEEEK